MTSALPLADIHLQAGAVFTPSAGDNAGRPMHYGDVQAEYWAARRQAVIIDQSHRGRLRVTGRDRIDLLNRLTTNDLRGLQAGRGLPNLFLTPKGRILELFDLLVFEDHVLLLLTTANGSEVAQWIAKFTFMEDVLASDVTGDTAEFGVFGPAAAAALTAAGARVADLTGCNHRPAEIGGVEVTVGGAAPLAGSGFRVICARDDAARAWLKIIAAGESLGLRAAGAEAEEILRIEAGFPASGHELSDRFNPLEAELRHAISFTKGCYTGQEVVARLNTYDKVQRTLRGLALTGDLVPPPGSRVLDADKEVGQVTSAVHSPARGAPLALAYLEVEHGEPGTRLRIELKSQATTTRVEAEAEVLAPPFVS